jgi:hypothetical protein
MMRIWRLGRRRDIIHVAWGPLTEKLKLQKKKKKKKKKKNLWWRSEDKSTTSPSLSHLDSFRSPPTRTTHPPTNFFQSTSQSYLLAACSSTLLHHTWSLLLPLLLLATGVLAGTQQSRTHVPTTLVRKNPSRWLSPLLLLQLAHGTFDQKKKAFEMFCRQTSFETLKPKTKKTLKMAFRVQNSIILTFSLNN